MGKNFCVCNDALSKKDTESNIFAGMANNKNLEKETIKTLNSTNTINQNSEKKTFQDEKSSRNNNNYGFNVFLNEMYKNNNKLLSEKNKNDNLHCSG